MESTQSKYTLIPVCCNTCDRAFFKSTTIQEHMIREHGLNTRVCIQCPNTKEILGGQAINTSKSPFVPEKDRTKMCDSVRYNKATQLVCNLCKKSWPNYPQIKQHFAKEHRREAQLCIAHLHDNTILCSTRPSAISTGEVQSQEAIPAQAETPALCPDEAKGVGNEITVNVLPSHAARPEPSRVVHTFGDVKVIRLVRPCEEPADSFHVEALEDEAYACDDRTDGRQDEVYETFDDQVDVPHTYSLYRNVNGNAFIANYENGSRLIDMKFSHISNDEMIDKMVHGTEAGFSFFLQRLFENPFNRLLYKRSSCFPLTDVHMTYGRWVVHHDSNVYPRVLESAASAMRKFINALSRTERFIKVFNGTRDYESMDHFMHILTVVRNPGDLDPEYTRDMMRYFYKYVKELRNIVGDYSEASDAPWVTYPRDDREAVNA